MQVWISYMKRKYYFVPALLSLLILSSCGKFKDPEFRGVKNLSVSQFNFKDPTLDLELDYFNPNKSGLKIKQAEGDAWADDQYLGHFTMDTLIRISGQSDFSLPVKFKADMKILLKNSFTSLLGKETTLKVEGRARVGKGIIFINYPIHYEGKHSMGELIK